MAYHITIRDGDGNVITDAETDAIALAYNSDEGINGNYLTDCNGETIFHLLLTLDELKEHMMRESPALRLLYEIKDKIVESKVEIDIGAIKRAMQERDQDE